MRGADVLAQTLAAAGVGRIYSLSGNQIMPLYDACIDAGIAITHVRHEAAAVFMADAWAQLTGKVGVALTTAAPGFANAVGALYTAKGSESPVLLLAGDSPVAQDGRGAFQELDQAAVAAPFVKGSFRPKDVAAMGADAAAAIRLALGGRPGPVHMALPFDILNREVDEAAAPAADTFAPETTAPDSRDVDAVRAALQAAERPLILTGPALNRTRAGALIERLEAASGAPVLALESPRGLNDPSLGDLAGALAAADLIVSLGKAIDFTIGFGASEKMAPAHGWIVVDAEPAAVARARRNLGNAVAAIVEADPKAMAAALAEHAMPARDDWQAATASRLGCRAAAAETKGISPADLSNAIQARLGAAKRSIVLGDGGEFGQWAQSILRSDARIINGPAGAIGACLPYAVAARHAAPDALIYVILGDGTVGFHLAEFETAVREGTAFVAVVGNDGRWNAEHQIQLRDFGPDRLIGCELTQARYDLVVAGLGGHGEHVTDVADLDAALARAEASGLPACVNVEIEGLAAPSGVGQH